jgi:hypothetical protein
METTNKLIPFGSKVKFKAEFAQSHQYEFYWAHEQYGGIVRLKSNAEMCGTDFDAKVEQLEVVDSN